MALTDADCRFVTRQILADFSTFPRLLGRFHSSPAVSLHRAVCSQFVSRGPSESYFYIFDPHPNKLPSWESTPRSPVSCIAPSRRIVSLHASFASPHLQLFDNGMLCAANDPIAMTAIDGADTICNRQLSMTQFTHIHTISVSRLTLDKCT